MLGRHVRIAAQAALIPLALLAMSLVSTKVSSHADGADAQFVANASSGATAEVRLGELAQERGSNQTVKDFGKRMVADHTEANKKLQMVAGKEQMNITNDLNEEDRATYSKLFHLSGPAFDRAYAADMVRDHRKDIADFEKEAKYGKDPAVREYAQQTLPTLKEHLHLAEEMEKVVGSSASR